MDDQTKLELLIAALERIAEFDRAGFCGNEARAALAELEGDDE